MLLETPRLTLRELTDEDVAALHRALGDPVVMSAYEHGFELDETRAWVRRQRERYSTDGFGLWGVVLRETGELIGDCGITTQQIEDDSVIEVGYHLARDHWHQGYAVEAARNCVNWAFATLDVDAVYAKVRDTNLPSMNVAIRLGMTVRRRFITRYRDIDMPHLAFAVSRSTWMADEPRLQV
ncbi:GNAT family N-acetyltransferase [Microbacterium lacus]|uniref:GNAT family N-acetyltransferase n=1 Tax=Microbacterium lacus TaxID=415217 RepID=UPI000C2B85BF|nr:GNAT family N-acetyltransferase [Microbacterium lacus]